MAIAGDFPLVARGRRGKGPRTKAKARLARARRAAELHPDAAASNPPRRGHDKTGTLASAHTIGLGTVHRPGHLHDPRSGRRV